MATSLRDSLTHVGLALREPEEFALDWHRGRQRYALHVWLALVATAIFGTMTYGMTMGISAGPEAVVTKGLLLTFAAGLAWAIPLPALYILNSMAGSRLPASTTLLAALVTTSWGGLALVASIPLAWFFSVAVPALPIPAELSRWIVIGVNLVVFAGVGVSMADVFGRVTDTLEPHTERNPIWFLFLVGVIGAQLFYLFHLFV